MLKKMDENSKFAWLPLILVSFAAFKLIDDYKSVVVFLGNIVSIMSPVIIGIAIAYVLNPLAEFIRKKWKLRWGWCVLFVYLVFLLVIIGGAYFAVPAVVTSMQDLISNIPAYVAKTQTAAAVLLGKMGVMDGSVYSKQIDSFFGNFMTVMRFTFAGLSDVLVSMASGITKFFIGVIISVYLLKGKHGFMRMLKKTIFAVLGKKNGDIALECCRETNMIFSNYLAGQIIDSLMVALIDTIGLILMGAPYAVMLGVFLGVFNLIPYLGPFVGLIAALIVTFIFGGLFKAIIVVVFIFAVFQFDAIVMGPKIVGSKIGVSPFWIIFSVTIGGGLFGIIGMLLGIPVVVSIGLFINRYIEKRLLNQGINIDVQ